MIFLCNQSGAVTFNEDRQEAKCGVIKFELKIRLRYGHCEISQFDRTNLSARINRFRGDNVLQRPVFRGTIGQIRRSCGVKFTIVQAR